MSDQIGDSMKFPDAQAGARKFAIASLGNRIVTLRCLECGQKLDDLDYWSDSLELGDTFENALRKVYSAAYGELHTCQ